MSEALIFASTHPQYDDRLFLELHVQYMKIPSSNLGRTWCVQKLFLTFRMIFVHMFYPCSAKRRASDKDLSVKEVDPYGWFMWYCRFYLGRRCEDDERQIGRWKNCTGPKGKRILFGIIQKKISAILTRFIMICTG